MNPTQTNPILSLCIPTYRRAQLLKETLAAVQAQWEEELSETQRSQIEILVSDNASPDDTPAVCAEFQRTLPGLSYFRQTENKGGDANIQDLIRCARGEFVYVVSDDDILLPGALTALLGLIETYPDLGAFNLNTRGFETDPSEQTPPAVSLNQDTRLIGHDACLRFLSSRITFISVLAFRRALIADRDYSHLIGTNLALAHLYLDVLTRTPGMVATCRPYLTIRGNNSGGFNFFEVFVTNFRSLMDYAGTQGYSQKTIRAVMRRHLHSYLTPYIGMFRVRGAAATFQPNFRDGARRLLAAYGPNPFLLFVLLPGMFAPGRLLRGLHAVKRSVLRGSHA